jgi:Kef-type K+ transport system membrane component KefB
MMATTGVRAGTVAMAFVYLIGFLLGLFLIGRPLLRWALRAVNARSGGSSFAVNTVVVIAILLGAAATQAMHMEAVFGAFAVGVLISRPGVADVKQFGALHAIVVSVLAPIFLATAGLRMDLTVLRDPEVLAIAALILFVAIFGKLTGAYAGARLSGLNHWEGVAIGAGMNARGVVEIVIALVGLRLGVLNVTSFTIIGLTAVVTSVMAPPILRWAMARIDVRDDELLRDAEFETWNPRPAEPLRPANDAGG